MKKINFEAGTQISPAKVTIDNVDHEVTPAVWEGNTPLSPFVLNKMQDNIEEEINNSGVVVSATEPTGSDRKKVWLQRNVNNIIGSNSWILNKALNNDGTIYDTSSGNWYAILEYIPFSQYEEKTITISEKIDIAYYDENKNCIQYQSNSEPRIQVVPKNTKYVRYGIHKDFINLAQINLGSTALPYEPYVEPKMYILNDNNVYEEFVQKEQNNYSTEEQVIGKWIDGKPLYRKVVDVNVNNLSTSNDVSFDCTNIEQVIEIKGIMKRFEYWEKLPKGTSNSDYLIDIYVYTNENKILIATGNNIINGIRKIYVIIEYTKTTD